MFDKHSKKKHRKKRKENVTHTNFPEFEQNKNASRIIKYPWTISLINGSNSVAPGADQSQRL